MCFHEFRFFFRIKLNLTVFLKQAFGRDLTHFLENEFGLAVFRSYFAHHYIVKTSPKKRILKKGDTFYIIYFFSKFREKYNDFYFILNYSNYFAE